MTEKMKLIVEGSKPALRKLDKHLTPTDTKISSYISLSTVYKSFIKLCSYRYDHFNEAIYFYQINALGKVR